MTGRLTRCATRALVVTGFAVMVLPGDSRAQVAQAGQARQLDTRGDLEAAAVAAEKANRPGEAWLLRARLAQGDFREGDRIVIRNEGSVLISDTLTVRAGKVLEFTNMGTLPLDGVLRSELQDKLTAHLSKYIREPNIRAKPLLRIAVIGAVPRPGFYYSPPDALLSDLMMNAGGPAQNADMSRVVIRRGPDVIWNAADLRTAIADGLSLDRLHLEAADEVDVAERRQISWLTVTQIGASLAGIILILLRT